MHAEFVFYCQFGHWRQLYDLAFIHSFIIHSFIHSSCFMCVCVCAYNNCKIYGRIQITLCTLMNTGWLRCLLIVSTSCLGERSRGRNKFLPPTINHTVWLRMTIFSVAMVCSYHMTVFGKKIHGKNHPGKNHPGKNHPKETEKITR